MTVLEKRVTRTYKSNYRHLDKNEEIGYIEVLWSVSDYIEPEDMCEPAVNIYKIQVDSTSDYMTIRQAIYDHFERDGCGHEHDCCGCRSYHVNDVARTSMENDVSQWLVVVGSSLNY